MADPNPRKPAIVRSQSEQTPARRQRRRQAVVQTPDERMNEILENARRRADDLASESSSIAEGYNSINSPSAEGLRRSRTTLSLDDPRANETTSVLSRRFSSQNYNTMLQDSDRPRHSPKSIYQHQQSPRLGRRTSSVGSDAGDEAPEPATEEPQSLWKRIVAPIRSVELENHGSVARDHLALERTFLAWLRTSLAFASIGIAVTQLFRLNTSLSDPATPINEDTLRKFGRPLGGAFLGISIVILLLGYRRFLVGQWWIIRGKFPASRGTVLALVLVTLAIMLLSLVVVVAIHPKGV